MSRDLLVAFILAFNFFVLFYFIAINSFYGFLYLISVKEMSAYLKRIAFGEVKEIEVSPLSTPVSLLAPAFNEEQTIIDSVKALLNLRYPQYEVLVINDGSEDKTLSRLIDVFELSKTPHVIHKKIETKEVFGVYESLYYPNLRVIDKARGGKSDALNVGINASRYPLFCSVDADSLIEEDSLLKAVRPFVEKPNTMIASGGTVRIANGCEIKQGQVLAVKLPKKILPAIQVVEYLRAFLFGRLGWSSLNNLLLISGAFGIFKKEPVIKLGGYKTNTVGEDLELVLSLHKYHLQEKIPYDIRFVPDPVCWTQAPETYAALRKQRQRWYKGLMNCLFCHKNMLFRPRYGKVGIWALPHYWLFELFGPLIELMGYILVPLSFLLGIINFPFFILFLIVAILYSTLISLGAVLLEEFNFKRYPRLSDLWKLFFLSILENIFFRQLNSLWRTTAFFVYFFQGQVWEKRTRKEFHHSA